MLRSFFWGLSSIHRSSDRFCPPQWFGEATESPTEPCEVKLCFVGHARAGKTSTLKALADKPFDTQQRRLDLWRPRSTCGAAATCRSRPKDPEKWTTKALKFHNPCRVPNKLKHIFLRVWGSVKLNPSIRHIEAIFLHDIVYSMTRGTSK